MLGFTRGLDPKDSLTIGTICPTKKWLESQGIRNTKTERVVENGETVFYVDVEGDVTFPDFHIKDISSIPEYIKFRNVSGAFIFENPQANISFNEVKVDNDMREKLGVGHIKLTEDWLKEKDIWYSKIERVWIDEKQVFCVDVIGDVILRDFHINDVASIPDYIKFRNVNGRFILGN